jgi:hypothetical protein
MLLCVTPTVSARPGTAIQHVPAARHVESN